MTTKEADIAIDRAEGAADPAWLSAAYAALGKVCAMRNAGDDLTTDAIWHVLDLDGVPAPREPRAIASVMQRAARVGLIAKTDRVKVSVRKENHGRPVAVWRVCH